MNIINQERSPGWRNKMRRFLKRTSQLVFCLAFSLILAACSGGGEDASLPHAQSSPNISTGAGLVPGPLDASNGEGPLDKGTEDEITAVAGDPLASGEPQESGLAGGGPYGGSKVVKGPLDNGNPLAVSGPIGDEPVGGGPRGRQNTGGNQ